MTSPRSTAFFALCTFLFAAGTARADEAFPARAERLISPGRSVASEDSTESLVLNPANLGNLTGVEARYSYFICQDVTRATCGHTLGVSGKLPFGLGSGLRFDYVQPPTAAGLGADYLWLTWGVGYHLSDRVQFGGSLAWSFSESDLVDHLFSANVGLSYRPNTHFGFALVGNDLTNPGARTSFLTGNQVLDRNYVLAGAFRPLGTRSVELGLEGRFFEATSDVRPRATLGIDIPGVGRARGDFEMEHLGSSTRRGVGASAQLEIGLGHATVGGGAAFGSGFGSTDSIVGFATASISDFSSPGFRKSEKAVSLRMEDTPGPRTHAHLLEHLWQLSERKDISAVTFVMRAEPSDSYAHAEELADAIRLLRARGKKVICSWEDAGPKALYVCASADRTVINPAGGLRYAGIKTTHMYLAGLLKKVGIKAEFVRIGAHKSAPEEFMNEHASDVAKADQIDLLAQYEGVFTENLVRYRKLTAEHVREVTAHGPFVASEAKEAGFVDGYAFDDEVERVTQEVVGHKVSLVPDEADKTPPTSFGVRSKVGLLFVDGDIIDGRSRRVPLLNQKMVGSYTIAEAAKSMREDDTVKSVVLRIESPGGSSMASDVMWRELSLLAEKKPLVVSMGSVAASGGYYIAMASKNIYALPLTITGSIGIFYGKADVSELLEKIGVNIEVRRTAPRADAESFYRGFTPDERKELEHKVGQFYDTFLDRVSRGRGKSKEAIDAMAQGRVWSGQQAVERGLVDHIGGLREALADARRLGGLPDEAPILESPKQANSLVDQALQLAGLNITAPVTLDMLPLELRDVARALAPFAMQTGDIPMARMEWIPLEAMPTGESD